MRLTGANQRLQLIGGFSKGGFSLCRWFEEQQTKAGVQRVKDWAAAKRSRLDDSDIFISGNADEVLNIYKLPTHFWSYVSGSQSIFDAQPGALSAVQQYSHWSSLDADG